MHFGFYETPPLLVETAAAVGLDLGRQIADGRITVLWQPPLEESEDALAERLLATVAERGIRRLFIDGLDGFLQAAVYPERMGRFFTALTLALRARGVTTLISVELPTLFGTTADVPLPRRVGHRREHHRAAGGRAALPAVPVALHRQDAGQRPRPRDPRVHHRGRGLTLADTSASAEQILADAVPPAPARHASRRRGGQAGRIAGVPTILVVDDERAIADLLSSHLRG